MQLVTWIYVVGNVN